MKVLAIILWYMAFLFQFWHMNFICHNGDFVPDNQDIFSAQNRGFKYGDGVFETSKVYKGEILLENLHFERLFFSLKLINIQPSFDALFLRRSIVDLCRKNRCADLARVRLAAYRDDHNKAGFVIEAMPLSADVNAFNEQGLHLGLYPYARKQQDVFANLKSANFLPYVLAGMYAAEKNFDDCLILNADGNICDTSKTNIFLIRKQEFFTPALHQGCVNGVMRRFVIDGLKQFGFTVRQKEITETDIESAEEIFLTNAIVGMRWVQSYKNSRYTNVGSLAIYKKLLSDALYK